MYFSLRAASAWSIIALALPAFTGTSTDNLQTSPAFTDPLAFYEPTAAVIPITAGSESLDYSVESLEGNTLISGTVPVSAGSASVNLNGLGPGYYELTVSNNGGQASTSLGIVDGASTMPDSSLFGTTIHPAIHDPSIDHSAAAGVLGTTTVRLDWRWEDAITADRTVFSWDPATEAEIDRLLARGIRPTLVLAYHGQCDDGRTPSSGSCIREYADFVRATAQKYGASVEYGIYNEFNTETNTSKCGRTPECYLKLLRPASEAIRQAAPMARITGPALGATDDWWAIGGKAHLWFERFVALGGHTYVDDVTIHNYSLSTTPETYSEHAVASARKILHAAGSSQPVVFEEGGYNTVAGGHTELYQAAFLVRDAAAVLSAGAGRYMHYGLIDNWNVPHHPEANFGLIRHEDASDGKLEPKPAAVAQAVLSRYLDGATSQGASQLGADARSSAFRLHDGTFGHILWSTDTMHTLLIHGEGQKSAVDIFGRTVTLYSEGGASSVGIGGVPVLLRTEAPVTISTL